MSTPQPEAKDQKQTTEAKTSAQKSEGEAVKQPKAAESAAKRRSSLVRVVSRIAGIAVLLVLATAILAYTATPAVIRQPSVQHYHFRMQLIADGKAVNFAEAKFQEGYAKDNCNADLTEHPFHFHDQRDQMVHVHWDNMTGGLLLKYYGWDYAGGLPNSLGYRFDGFPKVSSVPVYGHVLPKLAGGEQFYVYTGDEHGYQERSWDDFLKQDFETFFNKKSNLGGDTGEQTSFLDKLFPKAYAHGGEHHGSDSHDTTTLSEEELKTINNLLGNVVIFVQKEKPSDKQIKERFDHLVPLEASACAG